MNVQCKYIMPTTIFLSLFLTSKMYSNTIFKYKIHVLLLDNL